MSFYDHLIVPGWDYRQSVGEIEADVKKQAKEWIEREVALRTKGGQNEADVRSAVLKDAEAWTEKEVQRRLAWSCQEDSVEPGSCAP